MYIYNLIFYFVFVKNELGDVSFAYICASGFRGGVDPARAPPPPLKVVEYRSQKASFSLTAFKMFPADQNIVSNCDRTHHLPSLISYFPIFLGNSKIASECTNHRPYFPQKNLGSSESFQMLSECTLYCTYFLCSS